MTPLEVQKEQAELDHLRAEVAALRDWIRQGGCHSDTCTYYILGEICEGCNCLRRPLPPAPAEVVRAMQAYNKYHPSGGTDPEPEKDWWIGEGNVSHKLWDGAKFVRLCPRCLSEHHDGECKPAPTTDPDHA